MSVIDRTFRTGICGTIRPRSVGRVSEDSRNERTKCFDLGKSRTEDDEIHQEKTFRGEQDHNNARH